MQVAGVVRGAEGAEIEREHPGGMGAVDERVDAAHLHLGHQALYRHDQSGLTGDVVDEQQPRALGHPLEHARDDVVRRGDGVGDIYAHHLGAVEASHVVEGVAAGVVLVRGDEQFLVLVEIERAEDGIHSGGGIRHERQSTLVGAEELRKGAPGLIEQRLELPDHEAHRLALELRAQVILFGQNRDRRGAEGTVIEKGDARLEEPVLAHVDS